MCLCLLMRCLWSRLSCNQFFCCMYIDCTHTHVVNMADSPRKTQTKVTRRTSSAINLAAGEKGVHKMNGIEAIGQEHKGNEDTIFNK